MKHIDVERLSAGKSSRRLLEVAQLLKLGQNVGVVLREVADHTDVSEQAIEPMSCSTWPPESRIKVAILDLRGPREGSRV